MLAHSSREFVLSATCALVAIMLGSGLAYAKAGARRPPCSHTKCVTPFTSSCTFQLNYRCVVWDIDDCSTVQCPL